MPIDIVYISFYIVIIGRALIARAAAMIPLDPAKKKDSKSWLNYTY
jgi:hypothetical protein